MAWAVESQSSDESQRFLDEITTGTPCLVPVLWGCEVANGLLTLKRRRRISAEHYARARRAIGLLNPTVDEDGARLALGIISDLAKDHGLAVYDAVYLELAIRKRLPLASLDAALNRAAQFCNVKTLLEENQPPMARDDPSRPSASLLSYGNGTTVETFEKSRDRQGAVPSWNIRSLTLAARPEWSLWPTTAP